MQQRLVSMLGIAVILAVAYACSRNRGAIRWRGVILGLALQIGFAVAILGIPCLGVPGIFRFVFMGLNTLVTNLVGFVGAGSHFLFGPLADIQDPWGFVFAFRVLPSIIFFSSLMAGLYYLGVLQRVVRGFAIVMQKTMGTSGAETLACSGNIFMGQTESPMMVKPFLPNMTRSEMYSIMVGGMATVASGVEGAYVSMLQGRVNDIAGHLLTASAMGCAGGLIISKMIFPQTEVPETLGHVPVHPEAQSDVNFFEAVARGASDGVMLALNVAAMLVAFISLIALADAMIGVVGGVLHLSEPLTFARILGALCRPVAWSLGVPWSEAGEVGRVIGEKVVLNEFVGYVHLTEIAARLSDRTVLIACYALCGFANFSSIGIQIGGIGGMAPTQKSTIAQLGLWAVLAGNLASFLSACIAGILF